MEDRGITAKTARRGALVLAACALGLGTVIPAIAQSARSGDAKRPAISMSFERNSNFTPAGADPRLAAMFADRRAEASTFRFTERDESRPAAVRIAVRGGSSATPARTGNERAEQVAQRRLETALKPARYDLGASVGWKRLELTGDIASSQAADPKIADRDSATVGLNYDLKRVRGRVAVSADRERDSIAPVVNPGERYSLDVGGAVKISDKIAVTGGVRYRIDQDRLATSSAEDARRESQAVYVGTAFKF